MAQTVSAEYAGFDQSPSKAPDFLLAISGWPILYSVHSVHAIPATGGDLAQTKGFKLCRNWANLPSASESKHKTPQSEGGELTIGSCEIEILDRVEDGVRQFSDLLSRQAYLEGNVAVVETTLDAAIAPSTFDVDLATGTGFEEDDVVYIGHEAIRLGTKTGSVFSGCDRGWLRTDAVGHSAGVKVYKYLPTLFRQPAWIYKGYEGLPLDKWLPAFGGVITGATKDPGKVSLEIRPFTWEMFGGKGPNAGRSSVGLARDSNGGSHRQIARIENLNVPDLTPGIPPPSGGAVQTAIAVMVAQNIGDFEFDLRIAAGTAAPTWLGSGNYMLSVGEYFFGIVSIGPLVENTSTFAPGFPQTWWSCRVELAKGLGTSSPPERVEEDTPLALAWSNVEWHTDAEPTGLEPIDFMLRLLTSTGSGENGSYDNLGRGIGMGIAVAKLELESFTDLLDPSVHPDYDEDQLRTYFIFKKSTDGKKFIEEQLCRPFGWYIGPRNDGKMRLVRPKNPVKFYVSRANNTFLFRTSASPGRIRTAAISAGVRTASEMAAALQLAMNSASDGGFSISYSTSTHAFTIAKASGTFDLVGATGGRSWPTIGFTSDLSGQQPDATGAEIGKFTGDYRTTISQNDVREIQISDNQPSRIAAVWYRCNYNWNRDEFELIKPFVDAEILNLEDFNETRPYVIDSKGLLGAFSGAGARGRTPIAQWVRPANGCKADILDVSSSFGIDASNSFPTLVAAHLFDRYRNPPIRFKAKLAWKFNTLEVGDVVEITYTIDGVFADYERDTTTLAQRLFEVVSIKPNFKGGFIEAELLGHRMGT